MAKYDDLCISIIAKLLIYFHFMPYITALYYDLVHEKNYIDCGLFVTTHADIILKPQIDILK